MKKRRKWSKEYEEYRRKFYAEKKLGNVKQGVRVLTPNQYRTARKKHKMSDTKILQEQTMLHGQAEKKAFWREYKKLKKRISRGESIILEDTYFGSAYDEEADEVEGLSYHYNLSGLLKDKDAMHFMISYRILNGEDREQVLADYGY